jgi:signal transduction histidine kinase/ligand-binding sensor domain-containing protein
LNGSSTSRRSAPSRLLPIALAAAATLIASGPARALDPARGLSQYIRDEWSATRGYSGGAVYGFAQGPDGYLWIAAEKGLVRFDGLGFTSIVPPGGAAGGGPTVLGVASSDSGALWARLRGPALMAYRDDAFEDVMSAHNLEGIVGAMSASQDGSILIAAHSFGVVRYRRGQFTTVVKQNAMPRIRDHSTFLALVTSIAETEQGIWIGTRDAGLFRFSGKGIEHVTGALPDVKINCLLADPNGDVWIGTDQGVARVTGLAIVPVALSKELGVVPALALLRDHDSNLWIAAGSHGVVRLNGSGVSWIRNWDARSRGMVTALFEDRERNLWLGTSRSIERLRDGVFATYSGLGELPSDRIGPVHVDAGGRTWFAPTEGGLYWLDGEQAHPVRVAGLADDVVYSLDGRGQTVWVGRQYGGLTRVQMTATGPSAIRYTEKDGLAQDSVYVVHDPGDDSVWAGTLSGGVSHLRNGAFETFSVATGLVSNSVRAIASHGGTMWFGTPDGVSRRAGGEWRSYRARDGLPSNDVAALLVDRDGNVWAGTSAGLAVLRPEAARFELVPSVRDSVLALLDDQAGSLWCATADRLFRVSRKSLLDGGLADFREYDAADGLIGRESVRRQRTLRTDSRGRVWYATTGGLSVADPSRFAGSSLPAVLHILEVSADDTALRAPGPITVPSRSRRLSISFAAVSLAVPERIRYRYRLDTFDGEWSQASAEHTAVYTNLAPGRYTFRVIASASTGQWNGEEQTVALNVLPAFWQTTSFRFALLLLVGGAIWSVYRIRLMQLERQLNVRFEERLGERTRIAQELHDTLLQGFLSASMHLHVAAQEVPVDLPARSKLAYVQGLMGKVIEEGRHAIRGLRAPDSKGDDLENALAMVVRELGIPDTTRFGVIVEGRPHALHPLIRDEVYRIAREALANAIRHAHARLIEVTLAYRADRLVVIVRDDGVGIDDQDVVTSGREGHWGLAGMRERAAGIGARLTVLSRAGAGTEIELSIPRAVAFRGDVPGRSTIPPTRDTGLP